MAKVVRDRLMAVPHGILYRAITDFEAYPKFLSEVVGAKIRPTKDSATVLVDFELEIVRRFAYTLEFSVKPEEQVGWRLVESNFFKTNEGLWKLTSDGPKTQVHYELEVGFGFLVPSWVSKKLTEVNLPRMFDAFEERARSLLGG
jgi:ribosome-associated toxin RatA of RatAB toxin-antitoxin module